MKYKGDDLDLRTPTGSARSAFQASAGAAQSASSAWVSRALEQADESQPIWVDDTVLAVCNQAFDLAVALGAPEVGLEHLVHAMTQIEVASDILYDHNIHVSTLRRESTAIIMEDFPASRADGKSAPVKSADFEEVLYHAADRAYARRSPVAIADILDTLFDMSRDNASRKLLARHRTDFDLRDTIEPLTVRPAIGEGRQKVRVNAGSQQVANQHAALSSSAAETARLSEPPSITDTLQNTRIDAIERAIRELTDDIALNRKTFTSLIEELRGTARPATPPVEPTPPAPVNGIHAVTDSDETQELLWHIARVERSVDTKFNELARTWSILGERLTALEEAVESIETGEAKFELTPEVEARLKTLSFADDRLEKLETMLVSLPQRLAEMERRLQNATNANALTERTDKLEAMLGSMPQRLAEMERRLHHAAASHQPTFDVGDLSGKLDRLERLIAESPDGNFERGPVMAALRGLEENLRGIAGQVRDVNNRAGDVNLVVEGLNDRQERIERAIADQLGGIGDVQARLDDVVQVVRAEISDISSALLGESDGGERIQQLVEASLRGVTDNFERQRDTISSAVNAIVSDRFSGLAGIIQTRQAELQSRQTEVAQSLDQINARMRDLESGLEDRFALLLERPVVNGAGNVEMSYLNDAVGKIIANQHTLATSIDDWRAQASRDVSVIATRLERLETQPSPEPVIPVHRFDEIQERIDRLQTALAERQDGWSRFKLWLYGTTDWYGASWGGEREDQGNWLPARRGSRSPQGAAADYDQRA
jgi:prefoldin subunit 5